jgi:hypothetical protein
MITPAVSIESLTVFAIRETFENAIPENCQNPRPKTFPLSLYEW